MEQTQMILTDEEITIIQKLRITNEQKKFKRELSLRRIQTAAEFATWLDENGAVATYSTFCDDFGYDSMTGEDRPETYKIIMNIINSAS